jgi:hypothetical protein
VTFKQEEIVASRVDVRYLDIKGQLLEEKEKRLKLQEELSIAREQVGKARADQDKLLLELGKERQMHLADMETRLGYH